MRGAKLFTDALSADGILDSVCRVKSQLFGSLGATGHGHGSDKAVILGLQGESPETVDTDNADQIVADVITARKLNLAGSWQISFDREEDVILHRRKSLSAHPNGMTFTAFSADGTLLREGTFYSVGGGFVVNEHAEGADRIVEDTTELPYPFTTGAQLLAHCKRERMRIGDIMSANELTWRTEGQMRTELLHIWAVMQEWVHNGCHREAPVLPRGAQGAPTCPKLFTELTASTDESDPMGAMDWVNLFALAVNEENASGGRIVIAPTNGAAGIVPAVLHYYEKFIPWASDDGIVRSS